MSDERSPRRSAPTVLAVHAILLPLVACASTGSSQDPGVTRLATPPGAQERLSDYRPEQAFEPLAPGVGSRTVFAAESGEGYRIEIRDVLVGPKQAASELTLPGPAVLEVRSGSGALTIGGETRELPIGSTAAIEQGQSFDLRNTSDGPFTVRLVVFVAE